ncbi:MAG: hypothetical protein IT374_03780 [Polyangiaceae bacterium]|nr:hypothetical protein [Polyangiaceae bacterium]
MEGSCALQGDQCAWVDFRDPRGPGSSLYKSVGGDVYVFDRVHEKLRRVTFDSPATPRPKHNAAVEGNLVAWLETSEVRTVPADINYVRMNRVVRLDLDKGTRCWFDRKQTNARLIYQRRFWGLVGDADHQGGGRATHFDLDTTEIPWTCEPSPPPVEVAN